MHSRKKENKRKGFTLLELLIAIAIIGVLTSLFIVSQSRSKEQKQVELAARQLVADLREMQNNALTGKQDSGNPSRKVCGFGIHVESTNYQIFHNSISAGNCDTSDNSYGAESTDLIQREFPAAIEATGNPVMPMTIYFKMPFGQIFPNLLPGETVRQIILTKGETKYTVCVYSQGGGEGNIKELPGDVSC